MQSSFTVQDPRTRLVKIVHVILMYLSTSSQQWRYFVHTWWLTHGLKMAEYSISSNHWIYYMSQDILNFYSSECCLNILSSDLASFWPMGSQVGLVVISRAFHHYNPGSISRLRTSAERVILRILRFFSLGEFDIHAKIWAVERLKIILWLGGMDNHFLRNWR